MMGSGGGGGLGSSSTGATQQNLQQQQQQMGGAAEAASPISSIPPAMPHFSMTSASTGGGGGSGGGGSNNFDEDMLGGGDSNELGADPSSGGGGGNRWPRQETLALIKIRSEMDVAFRDATLKGPLWDHVSRKLGELGYKRSAKKCKEKFENVHKYYKRTKEGRAGRQDGKSYRFFTELEALHGTNIPTSFSSGTAAAATTTSLQPVADPIPVSVGFDQLRPPVISSVVQVLAPPVPPPRVGASFPSDSSTAPALVFTAPSAPAPLPSVSPATFGVSFSSEGTSSSSYSSSSSEEDDDNPMDLGGELEGREPAPHDVAVRHQHKRKRSSSLKGPHQHLHSSSNTNRERMMEFFEGLMKQVMQKQEAMQQRFLEAIEKREQDRTIREEAWKRQEMARLAREHELLSQERAVSASRDAAIVSFLQKITGQTIQLPAAATNPAASAAAVPVYRPPPSPPQPPPSSQQFHKPQQPAQNYFPQQQHQPQRSQQIEQLSHQPQQRNAQIAATTEKNQPSGPISSSLEMIVAVPNQGLPAQEIGSTAVAASVEATSSRWPKTEVLALIKLRSTLEPRYQEAGPKGPLWEEISAGMHRMGYKRSSKRCKEKWENINKYFKKVKESNKQRPEDAKTCPYFHELDALYQKKILGSGSSTATGVNTIMSVDQVQQQLQVKEIGMRIDTKFQEQGHVPAAMASLQTKITARSETKDGSSSDLQITKGGLTASLFGEGSDDTGMAEGAKKPESIVKEQRPQNHHQQLMMNEYGDTEKLDDDNLEPEDDEYNDDELDEDDEAEEETKMAYTIQFQRQGSSNGGGTGAPSFLAMVQ